MSLLLTDVSQVRTSASGVTLCKNIVQLNHISVACLFFSAVRLGLYIVYELTWSLKTKTFETCALEKILDLVIVTTCKPKYSVLISSRGQTLRTLASYNWTDYFFSVEEELFFSFVFPPIFFFFFLATMFTPIYIFFLATMFNPSNNKALLASSQFYVTRYNKWTYSVRLITLLVVNFLFLWPFTITAINTFLEGSDFHFHYIRKQWLQATGKNRTYLPDVGHHTNIAVVATKLAFRQKLFHYLVVYHGL